MSKRFPFPANLNVELLKSLINAKLENPHGMRVARYICSDEEGAFHTAMVTLDQLNEDGEIRILGAFYGYGGGGSFEDGFFIQDAGAELEAQVISGGDAEDRSTFREDYANDDFTEEDLNVMFLLRDVLATLWDYDDDEDKPRVTELGAELLESGEESDSGGRVFMDPCFEGDALSGVSESWGMTLRFED